MIIDKELDTRGLNCPLPILKAKKALKKRRKCVGINIFQPRCCCFPCYKSAV